ncbi:MAG: HAD-IA family hydrolase [Bacteroidales bacterium]
MEALLFDCDGVLVDTERDGHRVAFNMAFSQKGINASWSIDEYKELVKVAGGKERMKHYFDIKGWPLGDYDRNEFIKELHLLKTSLFMELIESGKLPLRPGVARLVDEAIAASIKLAVCSTSNVNAVTKIVEVLLGEDRKKHFSGIFAGDMVSKKKPDPAVYNLCTEKLGLNPAFGCVVEDSRNGLLAAKAAGYKCIITTNDYTLDEDFSEADAIYSELGDDPVQVKILDLISIINQ